MSSLKVKKGYKVRLFTEAEFKGKEVVFRPGDHDTRDVTNAGFENNMLTSFIVEMDDGTFHITLLIMRFFTKYF